MCDDYAVHVKQSKVKTIFMAAYCLFYTHTSLQDCYPAFSPSFQHPSIIDLFSIPCPECCLFRPPPGSSLHPTLRHIHARIIGQIRRQLMSGYHSVYKRYM